jgi:hypothetical protein
LPAGQGDWISADYFRSSPGNERCQRRSACLKSAICRPKANARKKTFTRGQPQGSFQAPLVTSPIRISSRIEFGWLGVKPHDCCEAGPFQSTGEGCSTDRDARGPCILSMAGCFRFFTFTPDLRRSGLIGERGRGASTPTSQGRNLHALQDASGRRGVVKL